MMADDIQNNLSNVSVPIPNVIEAKQLDLVPKSYQAPVYKHRRILQVSGGTSLTLSTSTTLSQFNIPGDAVWNLSRSYIVLDVDVAGNATPNFGNTHFTHNLPIDSIALQAGSTAPLVQIQNAQVYSQTQRFLCTPMHEYLSRGPCFGDTAIGTAFPISVNEGCQPARQQGAQTTVNLLASRPMAGYLINAGTPNVVPATNASGVDDIELSPQRVVSGAFTGDAATGATTIRYKIRLSAFAGTLLAVDKDLYFGQNLQLVIYWKPIANWGFASLVTALAGAPAALAIPTISNYYLYMATDTVLENIADISDQVKSGNGISTLVPYTTCSQLTIGNAGTYTISTPLTPGMGILLKRVVTAPILASNTLATTSNLDNVAGAKWSQVQSTLDSRPFQDFPLLMANSDVWNWMLKYVENTPAGLSQRTFDINCFFMDNFSDCDNGSKFRENDCLESGLAVDLQKTYEVQFVTATNNLILVQFQTWLRRLNITRDGVSLSF